MKTKEKIQTPKIAPLEIQQEESDIRKTQKVKERKKSKEEEILIKTKELISDKNRWARGALSVRDWRTGQYRFCVLGALRYIETGEVQSLNAYDENSKAAKLLFATSRSKGYEPYEINDGFGHQVTLNMLDKAIELAQNKKRFKLFRR